MTWAILVINIKGGTGKSTIAEKLTQRLKNEGYSVGAFDADIDSANLSTRMGVDERISFKGDHTVEPVEKNGVKLYSMENAFEDASFSQNGQFMREVIENMVNHSDWGDIDYMVVDCPPGSSDVFEELVRALRASLLGAISVGISDAVEDTARLVKICNHNWVPILGFVENMSGIYCHEGEVKCSNKGIGQSHKIYPFGRGEIEEFVDRVEGNFFGHIPLCIEDSPIEEIAPTTFDNMVSSIESAAEKGGPTLPDDNTGQIEFIKNLWGTVKRGKERMNRELDVSSLQDNFGVQGRDPLVIDLELTDAAGITSVVSEVVITVDSGDIKIYRPGKAKRSGISIEAGVRLTSQDLYDAMRGEKKVMNSVSGEITTVPYSIIDAVKMGDAEIWGERTINRLAVLDRILSDVVTMEEVTELVEPP